MCRYFVGENVEYHHDTLVIIIIIIHIYTVDEQFCKRFLCSVNEHSKKKQWSVSYCRAVMSYIADLKSIVVRDLYFRPPPQIRINTSEGSFASLRQQEINNETLFKTSF